MRNEHRPGKPLELLLRGCSEETVRRVNDNGNSCKPGKHHRAANTMTKARFPVTKIIDGAELLIPMAGRQPTKR